MSLFFKNNRVSDYKKNHFICFAIILTVFSCKDKYKINHQIELPHTWKFKKGDMSVSQVSFKNDSQWDTSSVSDFWENNKHINYDGYAWYKVNFFLPSSLKKTAFFGDSLKIFLGMIDDCDQVYMNQRLIGENNKYVADTESPSTNFIRDIGLANQERCYFLSFADKRILWDKVNTLAIRVFDQGGNGGLHGYNRPFISVKNLEDEVRFNLDKFYTVDVHDQVDTVLVMKNGSGHNLKGHLNISLENLNTHKIIYSTSQEIDVFSGVTYALPLSFPMTTENSLLTLTYEDKPLKVRFSKSAIIPYILIR